MNPYKFVLSLAPIAALLVATPAMGQITNFPVLSLAPGSGYGTTSVGTAYGRGVKNDALDNSVFVGQIERGLETISFGGSVGYIASTPENWTVSGSVAVHAFSSSPVQVSLQSGLGWIKQDILGLNQTNLHIPIGLAIQGTGFGMVRAWVMPRVSFLQTSGAAVAESSTETALGGSAGISLTTGLGVGLNLAYDYLDASTGSQQRISAGLSYSVGG